MNAMRSIVAGLLCFAAFGAARAATCTFNGDWDVEPSGASDEIVIASGSLTWDDTLPPTVASWSQTGGTVTFKKAFDAPLEVTGAVTLSGGTWTHAANGSAKLGSTANKYRVYVKCGGDMTIGADALITGEGLGYRSHQSLPDKPESGTQGGSYGGHGGMANAKFNSTYGSLFAPEELGNEGGSWDNTFGGGCVRLDVGGKLTLQGAINVNGQCTHNQKFYSGAGGSIFIHAGSIEGAGTLTANSGVSSIGGGGGRIAVVLTDAEADFTNYDIFNLANAHSGKAEARQGGCGTIYAETASNGADHGWLILKGNGYDPSGADANSEWYYADPFSVDLTSANFSKITIAGKTKFYIREGYTLDVTGTQFDIREAGYGLVVKGGTLMTHGDVPLNVDFPLVTALETTLDFAEVVVKSGVVWSVATTCRLTGNLTVEAGGTVSTLGASATPTHKLHLIVEGDMTVEEGGAVDVTAKGYTAMYCPSGKLTADSSGGSHGGWGMRANDPHTENAMTPYGSIKNPLTCGGGGMYSNYSTSGGGVVQLEVAGCLTVCGSILSNGGATTFYPGAGGSVNITAGSLVGGVDGIIEASGGTGSANTYAAAAGGRVAIRLTGDGADFSAYHGAFRALSYGATSTKNRRGGAGTVYLRTAEQDEDSGTLIVDNGTATSSGKTLVGDTDETVFGDVIVRGGAKLVLVDGATLSVSRSFANDADFVAGSGSTVLLVGEGTVAISGNTTFENLTVNTPGKVVAFAPGSTQKVVGALTVAGQGDNLVTLKSTAAGEAWNLDPSGATVSVKGAAIGDCHSSAAFTATESEDLGGNSANVTIIGQLEPQTLTWTGAVSSEWGDAGNWTGGDRAPIEIDAVIVPETDVVPLIAANAKAASLEVSGALRLDGKKLSVEGPLTVTGSIVATEGSEIEVGGDVTLPAGVTDDMLTLTLNGLSHQNVRLAGTSLRALVAANPSVSFAGPFTASAFTLGCAGAACEYDFDADVVAAMTLFAVNGNGESPNVTLRPKAANGRWKLSAVAFSALGAIVSGSDASGGAKIIAGNSQDAGGNSNWQFGETRIRWTGASGNASFDDGGNWAGGVAPTAADDVVIEGDVTVEIGVETAVANLTLGLGAKVSVDAPLSVGGNLIVEPDGTLVDNSPIAVGGDFKLLDRCVLTHGQNNATETKKVEIVAEGSGFLSARATVDVSGLGHSSGGPGLAVSGGFCGASYGGRGYFGADASAACYGSIVNPANVGSAGGWGGKGGGAVILSFGGALTLDTDILANGSRNDRTHYGSSGGAINITAAALAGCGSLVANGGTSATGWNGGGGRIAVKLTGAGADWTAYTGDMQAMGGAADGKIQGSAGTIFTRTAADGAGTLTIASGAPASFNASMDATDFPKTQDNDPKEVKNVAVRLGTKATLNLTADATVSSLTFDSDDARILLNGHKLYILGTAKRSVKEFVRSRATPGEDADGNPGEIIWLSGFKLLVR